MCDHCGCRSIIPIGRFMAEHEHLLDLAAEVRAALRDGEDAAAHAAFAEVVALLAPHVAAEERGLFAELRADGAYTEHLDRLEGEHASLAAEIEHLDDADDLSGASWSSRVLDILAELGEHIRTEEFGLFPAALATLGGAQWETIARA